MLACGSVEQERDEESDTHRRKARTRHQIIRRKRTLSVGTPLCLWEPPYVPTVLPTVGSYSLVGGRGAKGGGLAPLSQGMFARGSVEQQRDEERDARRRKTRTRPVVEIPRGLRNEEGTT